MVLPTWAQLLILEAACHRREFPVLGHRVLSEHGLPRTQIAPIQAGLRRAVRSRMAHPFAHGTLGRASLANRGRSPSRPAIACVHDAPPALCGFPHAWQVQRDRARIASRINTHSWTDEAGRPFARGPPARIRLRAARPIAVRRRERSLIIASRWRSAPVGKRRGVRDALRGTARPRVLSPDCTRMLSCARKECRRCVLERPAPPTPPGIRDSPQGRLQSGVLCQRHAHPA